MYKLFVLSVLVAVTVATPVGYGASFAYTAPVAIAHSAPIAHDIHVPAAVSTSFRRDVIHKPVVTSYTVPEVVGSRPVVEKFVGQAPVYERTLVQPGPLVEKTLVQPATYTAPVLSHAAPLSYAQTW
ncbi:unnamed protein product [Brassicogethes aeneus]|uniref:Uncharacterized protein n=1 Tax=Brassicogethes aeneus TaxID=1431903 RepID=A0A9P0FC27_BRAAE|nr:unnamed protein product [Brassicogethes aeneus]